jgi:hypothetical protein
LASLQEYGAKRRSERQRIERRDQSLTEAANLLSRQANLHCGRPKGEQTDHIRRLGEGVAEMLAAEGLDVRALFAAAGIDPAALEAPGARVQTEKVRAGGTRLGRV